jgi:two-component system chemotaxis response regulator CheB
MTRTRVLVVDDSATVRGHLTAVLSTDPQLDVVAETGDGAQAVELCQRLRPDVITMDMVLPGMSGLVATEHIMAHCPTPILVVSSSTNRGELFRTCDALAAGAVDVLEKPDGHNNGRPWERQLIAAVKMVARIKVITHPRLRLNGDAGPPVPPSVATRTGTVEVLAVGASTGGPHAIVEVLRALPRECTVPVLLVLHINEPFGAAFAGWLGSHLSRPVRYPRDEEPLSAVQGTVVMAPPGEHLEVRHGRLHLTDDPERHSCRPSVDVLFQSLARELGSVTAGCLLTGMGRDGAAGLLALRQAGARTVAQDEHTSTVYGMPREAVRLGAAELVLPLDEIGSTLARFAMPVNGAPR